MLKIIFKKFLKTIDLFKLLCYNNNVIRKEKLIKKNNLKNY